ncbi:MAG: SprT-like domain-containing protein [Aridibacter sp.]
MKLEPQQIEIYYEEAFGFYDGKIKTPKVEVEFYPYVNVNSRIQSSNGVVSVRIAELLNNAPSKIHKALAYILVAKLLGEKVPENARKVYRDFLNKEAFQKKAIKHKRKTGRKVITSPIGNVYNLENIFGKLNLVYFQNEIKKPKLSWSQRKTYRRLGHHDPVHNAIIISKSLDEKTVPKYVVECVVYHEMLHIKHPVYQKNGRRCVHTREFKNDEEKFPYFDDAEKWINENALKIKRKVKRSS